MVKPLRAAMGKVSSRLSGKTVTTCARIRYEAGYSGQRFVLSADGVIRRRPVAVRMARFRPTQGAADVTSISDLGAAESGRRETAVAEMFGSRINGTMLIAARTVDRRFEAKGSYLAERRERGHGSRWRPAVPHAAALGQLLVARS